MAGKGYRPALFELVRKGPLKPNQKGTLTTPKWFYNRKSDGMVESQHRETEARGVGQQDISAQYDEDSVECPSPDRPESIVGLHLADKKLALWAPYWAIGLVFMGLFLGFLVVFWLGQNSVRRTEMATFEPSRVEASLEEIREGPVQRGVLDLSANSVDNIGSATAERQAASMANVPNTNMTAGQSSDVVKGRNCLVLCSSSQRELRSVQEYFSKKGVLTKIGRFNGSYIVYCEEGADRPSESGSFRNRMVDIGKRYNSEKPRGAASFPPSTFDTAYWAARDRITIIEQ